MSEAGPKRVVVLPGLASIAAQSWDACANPYPDAFDPFVTHSFLKALEDSGAVGPGTGWIPQHLVLEDASGAASACLPLYIKLHSQGEFVFDHGWAEALHRAGGSYYPKLQSAVPFTPATGRRLLSRPGPGAEEGERVLARAAIELAKRKSCSSLHVTFLTEPESDVLATEGFHERLGVQYHWTNAGYASFDDFLATLASRKRKSLRRERAEALADGIEIEHVTGSGISEAHWDAFFGFYMDTADRKWGRPYLNRRFFSLIGEAMANRILLVLARRGGRYIAGALNFIGSDCLYGRYWGAVEHVPFLHFEVCYYQAIDFAIARGLARVEAGAQGEHKLIRGYRPVATRSAHWLAEPQLEAAVARFLDSERREILEICDLLNSHTPYKKAPSSSSG